MNYYEHHLGDYLRDTAHLSMLEDGAYRRLLDAYYIREEPLPASSIEIYRLVRAREKSVRAAVDAVLTEFFSLGDDGWRHARCDREISRFQDKQRKAKASADARWSNRASLSAAPSVGNANASADAMRSDMRTHSERNAPRARPQTPVTSNQSPEEKKKNPAGSKKPPRRPLPDDFDVSDRVRRWAGEKGFDRLEQHLEAFLAKCRANGYAYADWDSAFMEAIREDWAKLRGRTANGAAPPPEAARASTTGALARMKADRMTPEEKAAADKARLEVMAALHQPRNATA